MLRLIIGKAGAGKTAAVMEEIRQAVCERRGGQLLLVPEQYSHEAERELCRVAGDSLSLYGEVLSFTGLARRVSAQLGGGAASFLDKGGRLLCMTLALQGLGGRLQVYREALRRPELQVMLLRAVDELKSACVDAEQLESAAQRCGDELGAKLRDLALIRAAFDASVARGHTDPADRLTVLAEQIAESSFGPESHVYVDGFLDFTAQERAVLTALLAKGTRLTVCLTLDALHGEEEIFAPSRAAARQLLAAAEALGVETRIESREGDGKAPALRFFADRVFRYDAARWPEEDAPIHLSAAESMSAECEQAAARVLELVRDGGCRWRDIAVAVRGFEDYRATLESVFRHYGVPLFTARRSELLSKPLPALIALSYEILDGGWDPDDVISYMRTGLTGLDSEECDLLAGYLFTWQLRGGAWERPDDWRQHPDGYQKEYDDAARGKLRRINALRRRLAAPLLRFRDLSDAAETAAGQAAALAGLLEELALARRLQERAAFLEQSGQAALAGEYRQLWEITVSALEQCAAILGDTEMDRASFGRLFALMLSQYDVGLIPVSLDRVSAGDFDRMRRRNIRHLLVLGCSDDRLPPAQEAEGVFSDEERERLLALDIELGGEDELWREFALIYNCLSLPSESLSLSYALSGAEGEEQRPAFVFSRACALFGKEARRGGTERARLSAPAPALNLAAQGIRGGSRAARTAAAYFRETEPKRFARLEAAADMSRGRLSPAGVEALYGKNLRLSASKIDRFASCQFSYFCQYGLQAKPREPAAFAPPEIGDFIHYLLENTLREVKARGGFAAVPDEALRKITDGFVKEYVHTKLNDFEEKSSRFVHLFKRLCGDARQIVADMADELRRSDFVPLDFELNFAQAEGLRPIELGEGEEALRLTGVADRVDGWLHDGKLYLRVVDYKTGKKVFSLSDVWYGMGLQMLLYLMVLEADGEQRYGCPVVPAGVMYVPARNALVRLEEDAGDEAAEDERLKALRRSGLVLDDSAAIEAWEKGDNKRYIPVKFSSRGSDSLASAERFGELAAHIRDTLADMARQLRRGSIAADPYYRTQQETACLNCKFFDACHFADGENGESFRYLPKLKDSEVWSRMEGGTDDA